jgi:hypothetical protein
MSAPGSAGRPARTAKAPLQRAGLAVVALTSLTLLAVSTSAGAAPPPRAALKATPLQPAGQVQGAKSASSRLAQTDQTLLGRDSSAPVHVVVQLRGQRRTPISGTVSTDMTTPLVRGTTTEVDAIDVTR